MVTDTNCWFLFKRRLLLYVFIFIIAFFAGKNTAFSQQIAKKDVNGRGYLEYLPPDYNNNSDLYPVMIFLHGSGERGNGSPAALEKIKKNGPPKNIANGHNMCFDVNGTTECLIVLSPQTTKWGWQGFEVIPFVQAALEEYRIDPQRIYLTGLSMGGQGCWQVGYSSENNPNYFAALAPAPGRGGYQEACIIAQNGIPVWAFHGDKDTAMKLSEGQRPIKGMNQCNPDPVPIFTIYAGAGHSATWNKAYRTNNTLHTPNLYQWLLAQRKGAAPQTPPNVNAGTDVSITLPTNTTQLTASAADTDGTIVSIEWKQESGPNSATTTDLTNLTIDISNLVEGRYTFSITATDNDGLTGSDQIIIDVFPEPANVSPSCDAGSNKTITLPLNISSLEGSSTDSDGTVTTILWEQTSGPNTANIETNDQVTTNITGLIEGSYSFLLTVTDDDGDTGTDNVSITVLPEPANIPPSADAGADQEIELPLNSTTLTGTGTDSDGTISTYAWEQSSGPNTATSSDLTLNSVTLNDLIEGSYIFNLTVTDDDGDTDSDQIIINVVPPPPNDPPSANAGNDISITLPISSTDISGTGSDSDGSISNYSWAQISGPNSADLTNISLPDITASNLIEGVYVFSLTVTDDDGAEDTDNITVTVLPVPPNIPPTVNAGSDISTTLPSDSVEIIANSSDTDGSVVSILWQQMSGPNTSTITDPANLNTSFKSLTEGIYQFSITVTDDDGDTDIDQVVVTVFPDQNNPPVVNAGNDISIELPANSTSLNGTGTDSDGSVASTLWEQITGPGTATIDNENSLSVSITELIEGIYVFRLTVTDNEGAENSDQISITVNPESPNSPPVANAGEDVTLLLPQDSIIIGGTGTDSDGTIVSYLWELVSGGTAILGPLDEQNIEISELEEGIYVFKLTVEDNDGAVSSDQTSVFVNYDKQPPISNAGGDIEITLPIDSAQLLGEASDSDGTVTLTLWEQTDGPSTASIDDQFALNPKISNLLEGIYIFSLYVQDNDNESDTDNIRITVNPEIPNNPPIANAGSDIQITLPVNSVSLEGTGEDSDGTILSYNWSQVTGPNTAQGSSLDQSAAQFSNMDEGLFQFRLTVTDNLGLEGSDEVNVSVLPAPGNQLPIVDTGNDIEITLPVDSTTLIGSVSDNDGSIASIMWTQEIGPTIATLSDPTMATLDISNLSEGIFTFRMNAIDDEEGESFDQVVVVVNPDPANQPPTVVTSSNLIIRLPQDSAEFIGTAEDIDGSIAVMLWEQTSGPSTASLKGVNTSTLVASSLIAGTYIFRITVTDNEGTIDFDDVNVRVLEPLANQPPLVSAGENKVIIIPQDTVMFVGTASDSDGSINSTNWEQVSGPSSSSIINPNQLSTEVDGLELGTYVFQLSADDDGGLSGFDQINVRVNPENPNLPPEAVAGINISIQLPVSDTTLTGSASDTDGIIQTVQWSQQSGPNNATIEFSDSYQTRISDLMEGSYVIRFTCIDDDNDQDFDDITITVLPAEPNILPEVEAGEDQFIIIPNNSVTLSGTYSDSDGTISSTLWAQQSGPSNSTIQDAGNSTTLISDLIPGTYVFRLTVTDDRNDTNFDQVSVFVYDNIAPSAFAGSDTTIIYPTNEIVLQGDGVDSDGTVVSVEWAQTNGPSTASLSAVNENSVTVTELIELGMYEFSFTVTDDKGGEGMDIVAVTVATPEGNQSPIADAGEDILVLSPTQTATIMGTGTDPDGIIEKYQWSQIDGPVVTLIDTDMPILIVNDLELGVYSFELTVTDDGGLTNSDQMVLSVETLGLQEIKIPKILTPNGDGENDIWLIENLEAVGNCKVSIITVNGKTVFEANPYLNNWDCTYQGSALEAGSYYYILECDGAQRTGGIRIIR